MKFSKIYIKHHAFNKRIMRIKEINRQYNLKPNNKIIRMILEKDHDLGGITMPEINSSKELAEFGKKYMLIKWPKYS